MQVIRVHVEVSSSSSDDEEPTSLKVDSTVLKDNSKVNTYTCMYQL